MALGAWLVPLVALLLLGIIYALDYSVPYPEPVGEPLPCYAANVAAGGDLPGEAEDGETICPEEPMPPPSTLRVIASALNAETVRVVLTGLGVIGGLVCAVLAIARTRNTRRENPADRTAFRIALSALILLVVVPLGAGGLLLFALMTFRIAG